METVFRIIPCTQTGPVSMAQVQIPEMLPDLPGKFQRHEDPRLKSHIMNPHNGASSRGISRYCPRAATYRNPPVAPSQENSLRLRHLKILWKRVRRMHQLWLQRHLHTGFDRHRTNCFSTIANQQGKAERQSCSP